MSPNIYGLISSEPGTDDSLKSPDLLFDDAFVRRGPGECQCIFEMLPCSRVIDTRIELAQQDKIKMITGQPKLFGFGDGGLLVSRAGESVRAIERGDGGIMSL